MAVYIGKDQPTGWVVMHYGVPGMRWGRRKSKENQDLRKKVREHFRGKSSRDPDRAQIDDIKTSYEEMEQEILKRNPNYVDPIHGDPSKKDFHLYLDEDGRLNKYYRKINGRDGRGEYVMGKRTKENVSRAHDELSVERQEKDEREMMGRLKKAKRRNGK